MSRLPITFKEAFKVLGVNQTATVAEVTAAYKRLALQTHPDRNPHDISANAKFIVLAEAFIKLLNVDEDDGDDDDDMEYDDLEFSEEDFDPIQSSYRLFGRIHGLSDDLPAPFYAKKTVAEVHKGGVVLLPKKNTGGFMVDGMLFTPNGRLEVTVTTRGGGANAPGAGTGNGNGNGNGPDNECDCPKCQRKRDPEAYREAFYDGLMVRRRQERAHKEENKAKPLSFKYATTESDINLDWLDEVTDEDGGKARGDKEKGKKKKKAVLSKEERLKEKKQKAIQSKINAVTGGVGARGLMEDEDVDEEEEEEGLKSSNSHNSGSSSSSQSHTLSTVTTAVVPPLPVKKLPWNKKFDKQLSSLLDMGFESVIASNALMNNNGNVEIALYELLNQPKASAPQPVLKPVSINGSSVAVGSNTSTPVSVTDKAPTLTAVTLPHRSTAVPVVHHTHTHTHNTNVVENEHIVAPSQHVLSTPAPPSLLAILTNSSVLLPSAAVTMNESEFPSLPVPVASTIPTKSSKAIKSSTASAVTATGIPAAVTAPAPVIAGVSSMPPGLNMKKSTDMLQFLRNPPAVTTTTTGTTIGTTTIGTAVVGAGSSNNTSTNSSAQVSTNTSPAPPPVGTSASLSSGLSANLDIHALSLSLSTDSTLNMSNLSGRIGSPLSAGKLSSSEPFTFDLTTSLNAPNSSEKSIPTVNTECSRQILELQHQRIVIKQKQLDLRSKFEQQMMLLVNQEQQLESQQQRLSLQLGPSSSLADQLYGAGSSTTVNTNTSALVGVPSVISHNKLDDDFASLLSGVFPKSVSSSSDNVTGVNRVNSSGSMIVPESELNTSGYFGSLNTSISNSGLHSLTHNSLSHALTLPLSLAAQPQQQSSLSLSLLHSYGLNDASSSLNSLNTLNINMLDDTLSRAHMLTGLGDDEEEVDPQQGMENEIDEDIEDQSEQSYDDDDSEEQEQDQEVLNSSFASVASQPAATGAAHTTATASATTLPTAGVSTVKKTITGVTSTSKTTTIGGEEKEKRKSIQSLSQQVCKYFYSKGGCVRGSKCFYAHKKIH